MKKLFYLFILILFKLNICQASLINFPLDIKHTLYDASQLVIKGELLEISFLYRRDAFGKDPVEEIQNLSDKLCKSQSISTNMPHSFYIIKVKVKEIYKNESILNVKPDDEIYVTFIEYDCPTEFPPKEKEIRWLFLETSKESTLKQLTKCFERVKKNTVVETPIAAPMDTLYFNGVSAFPVVLFVEGSELSEALDFIREIYQIEDLEEQTSEWQRVQAEHKENSFLQYPWDELNYSEDFNY
ncbi:MAG: hypothetical protein KAI43_05675 [Candidatus Aureabacteria bacterium]|nr:hypothetical protein [Candidatus Auribacterota bacterium]